MMRLYQGNKSQERWQVEVYHKSLKQNASLACSPTRTKTTQGNHATFGQWQTLQPNNLRMSA